MPCLKGSQHACAIHFDIIAPKKAPPELQHRNDMASRTKALATKEKARGRLAPKVKGRGNRLANSSAPVT
jgi:hypothetical protein